MIDDPMIYYAVTARRLEKIIAFESARIAPHTSELIGALRPAEIALNRKVSLIASDGTKK